METEGNLQYDDRCVCGIHGKKKTGSKDILMSLGVSILGAILIFTSIFLTPVSPMIPFLVICA